jgi:hypothetical protein
MTNLKRSTSILLIVLGLLVLGLFVGCGASQIEPEETKVNVEDNKTVIQETEDKPVAASDVYTPEVLEAFRHTCDTFENRPEM